MKNRILQRGDAEEKILNTEARKAKRLPDSRLEKFPHEEDVFVAGFRFSVPAPCRLRLSRPPPHPLHLGETDLSQDPRRQLEVGQPLPKDISGHSLTHLFEVGANDEISQNIANFFVQVMENHSDLCLPRALQISSGNNIDNPPREFQPAPGDAQIQDKFLAGSQFAV
jgi:hypothetical protein